MGLGAASAWGTRVEKEQSTPSGINPTSVEEAAQIIRGVKRGHHWTPYLHKNGLWIASARLSGVKVNISAS